VQGGPPSQQLRDLAEALRVQIEQAHRPVRRVCLNQTTKVTTTAKIHGRYCAPEAARWGHAAMMSSIDCIQKKILLVDSSVYIGGYVMLYLELTLEVVIRYGAPPNS
jgi:hypothetical protein